MDKRIKIQISAEQIAERVRELGKQIAADYAGKEVVLVGVLKGSFIFMADLARAIELPDLRVEFLGVQSYGDETSSSGVVQITFDLTKPIDGKHVLIIEDIVDTGLTMEYLLEQMRTRHPASVKLCALLHKPSRVKKPCTIDYLGFTIPDLFVIGYGLDYAQKFRNLPYIGVLGE
ncbi:MAG TPA: hypoxanthine phosphoribosyltransferase [Polyangia bacterium]|nr:hypoxanthine phosphoribosyltransferase [Polyangia bacterium]